MSVQPPTYPSGARPWGMGRALRLVCTVLAALALAGAVVIVVLPLPRPAAGGTCGPGTGSETAIVAFFDPVSIGAGTPPPSSQPEEVLDRLAFIGECQASANGRMVDGLALVVLAAFFALAVPPAVRRAWQHEPARALAQGAAQPGWYPDPTSAGGWRWWDGGHPAPAGGVPPPASAGSPGTAEGFWPAPVISAPPGAPLHPDAAAAAPQPAGEHGDDRGGQVGGHPDSQPVEQSGGPQADQPDTAGST